MFGAGPHLVAIAVEQMEEMFVLPETHRPPGAPPNLRGLISSRHGVLPALDLRVCLGLESALLEMEHMLDAREQDHRVWIDELEASVREHRAFGLTTDPRQCKFGRWYYGYHAEDSVLRWELERIEQPHAAIHAVASQVAGLVEAGRNEEAERRVQEARSGAFTELLSIFGGIRQAFRKQHREIGVTVRLGEWRGMLIVDRAEAVSDVARVTDEDDPFVSGGLRSKLVQRMGRWDGAKQLVLVLDVPRIVATILPEARDAAGAA